MIGLNIPEEQVYGGLLAAVSLAKTTAIMSCCSSMSESHMMEWLLTFSGLQSTISMLFDLVHVTFMLHCPAFIFRAGRKFCTG